MSGLRALDESRSPVPSPRSPLFRSQIHGPESRFGSFGSPVPGPRSPLSQGFTLLEILLALVLVAFVMLGVWGGMSGATRITHSADATMAQSERVHTTQRFLRTWLAAALPEPYRVTGAKRARMFRGEATAMRYVGPLPTQSGHAGLYLQTLELVKGNAGRYTLVLQYLPYTGKTPADTEAVTHKLLTNLDGGTFQYLAAPAFGTASKWRNDWSARNGLPLAVRIHLDPAWHTLVSFPDLLIRLHAGGGVGARTGGATP